MSRRKALLLSAYDAQSHRRWHQMLTTGISEYEWTVVTLPAHHFYWRVRSNGLSFALEHREQLIAGYDVLVATSMVDLATLCGLVPELAQVPALVYFHENQFDYPLRSATPEHRIINAQFGSIVTALRAKRVLFNSDYNRRTFLSGMRKFIKRMPDGLSPTILHDIESKAAVVPVPIANNAASYRHKPIINPAEPNDKDVNTIDLVWAHRWEFDKQPEVFFDALEKLYNMPDYVASGITVYLHVMGQSFREVPECFQQIEQRGTHNIRTWGYQSKEEYIRILSSSDIVVSTALHDFQGLGMLEAIHHGCIPVAPNRVAYPEYIPEQLLYNVEQPKNESTTLAEKLCQLLCHYKSQNCNATQVRVDVSGYLEHDLIDRYRAEINAL